MIINDNYLKKVKSCEAERQVPTALPVYQSIASTTHVFEDGQWYSLSTLGRILGFSHVGIRQRCITDNWPTLPVWCDKHRIRRPQFVSGDFLRRIQAQVKEEVEA